MERESQGEPAKLGSSERMAIKLACICVLLVDHLVEFIADLFSAAPPERPTAPKPGQQQQLPAAAFNVPRDAVLGMPGGLGLQASMMGMPQLPSSEAPKLKDFLPFMKPGSFGPKAQVGSRASTVSNDCAPGSAGSLPASVSASPVHLPQAPVSFPPSPQRQLPVSVSASNGYVEVSRASGIGFTHADAGYPVAEALLSPTAPPGAPRSASPAHQQPAAVAHPGGPAESQQPLRPMDMSYNIPQNYSVSQSSVAMGSEMSTNIGSHTGGAMQVTGQPPAASMPVYSGPNFNRPGMYTQSGVTAQHALPSNTASFQGQVPGQPPVVPSNAAPPPNVLPSPSTHPQHTGLPHGSVGNIGSAVVSTNWNQSYPGGNVAASTAEQRNPGTAIPGVPVQQVNNSNNVLGKYSSVDGGRPSNVEVSKPHYYTPSTFVPPTCTAVQSPCQPQPPSYEVVTQHYLPPTNLAYPGFTGPPSGVHVQPGLSSAALTSPMQTSYQGRPEVSYGSVHAGHLPASNQQPVTTMHPQNTIPSQPQQLPPARQILPGNQRPVVPPQHPVMPASAAYMEQQLQHISQNQSRYPLASQTVPGLPMPNQLPSGVSHAPSQTPSQAQYPANVQMPATRPQPRYPPVPNTLYSYPAGVQPTYQNTSQLPMSHHMQPLQPTYQNTSQLPMSHHMQPMHTAASHVQPAVTSQQQLYQQYPVQPDRPEVSHTPVYLPGSQPQPRYPCTNQYPDSSQPTAAYHQPPSVNSQQQQQHYRPPTPQHQPLYHPGSSQPPVVNQSTTISSNFSTPQTPYSNQQQPQTTALYNQNVNNAPGEMQAFAEIPVCLPSPLQPSRVNTVEVSKNVDSLRDLDLSGRTSSASDAQPKQKDSDDRKLPNVDSTESKDVATDSSSARVEEQRENSEEETRRSLHCSRSSRDIYADTDTLARFVAEVEKFQKHVDSLSKPTLGGYFPLDKEWKVS